MHRSRFLRRTLVARYTQERASLIEIACESSSGYPALVPYGRHYAVRPPRDELARLIQATPTNGATSRGAAVSSMMRSRLCTPSRQDMAARTSTPAKRIPFPRPLMALPTRARVGPPKGDPCASWRPLVLVKLAGNRRGRALLIGPAPHHDMDALLGVPGCSARCRAITASASSPSLRHRITGRVRNALGQGGDFPGHCSLPCAAPGRKSKTGVPSISSSRRRSSSSCWVSRQARMMPSALEIRAPSVVLSVPSAIARMVLDSARIT